MTTAREIVENIRRTKFFIGMQLAPEAEIGIREMRRTMHRLLEIVSKDLYSRETHFVLELVQNADDNHYPPGIPPQISFFLEPDKIVVANNEVGFEPANVRALCTVGDSTKVQSEGSIGEKGIGFKSVFAVSDRPEIHSNGFHFRFDVSNDEILGYIVPEWIDGQIDEPGTKIILPAKRNRTLTSNSLSELSAALLLFLRRLRQLNVSDAIAGTTLSAVRSDEGSCVTLTSTTRLASKQDATQSIERYLRVEHAVFMADVTEEKRAGITQTQLVLAFPLNQDGTARANLSPPVYAYLPTRSVGFKFVLQADFVLSSSREDIHQDRLWNVRIRDEIATAFAAAVPHLKSDENLARTFFDYVPGLLDVADSFFDKACDQITARLRTTECVQGRSGSWCTPAQILLSDSGFQALFSDEDVTRVLQLEYPALNFTPIARTTLADMGAENLSLSHVVSMLQDQEFLAEHSAQWFSALYDYLAQTFPAEQSLKKLRQLTIVGLSGGGLASSFQLEIFFPLGRGKRYGFEGDLHIVDPAVLMGSRERTARVREFLIRLGVHVASAYELIESHILPQHAADSWESTDLDALAGHVAYIKDHLQQYIDGNAAAGVDSSAAIEKLRRGLYVRTTESVEGTTYFNRPQFLYLPKEYRPDIELEWLLGPSRAAVQFVSPTFLEPDEAEVQESVTEWRKFFYQIGVNRVPNIMQTQSGAIVDYHAGAALKTMLASGDSDTISAAIRLIDTNWISYYRQFRWRRHVSGATHEVTSTFLDTLLHVLVPTTKKRRIALRETFLNSDAVRVVFGRSPAYLTEPISNPEFMDAVGVTHRIDAAACIRRIDRLRQADRVSLSEVRTLYKALEGRIEVEASTVVAALTAQPRIYVPAVKSWFNTTVVVWNSTGPLLDSLYPPLALAYPEHKSFFCKKLSVASRPTEAALVSALKELSSLDATPERRQREAYSIFRTLSDSLREGRRSDASFTPAWLVRLRSDALFLDHVGRMVSADNDLYIDDEPRLAEVFKDVQQVSFVPIDRAHLSAVRILLEACGIPTLSESVRFERPSVTDEIIDREFSARIRERASAIMRFLFHRHHSAFEYASEIGAWDRLSHIEVRRVADLTVNVLLASHSAPFAPDILREGNMIYLRHDARAPRDKLCAELCALLGARGDVADALYRVVFAAHEELQEFFESKGIDEIPADELAQFRQVRVEEDPPPDTSTAEPTLGLSTAAVAETELSFPGTSDSSSVPFVFSFEPQSAHLPDQSTSVVTPSPAGAFTEEGAARGSVHAPLHGDDGQTQDNDSWVHEGASRSGRRADRPRSSGRLLSYAEPREAGTRDDATGGTEEAALRRQLAAAAVSFVIESEREEGHEVQEMAFNNEGFDLQRTKPDGSIEYIEVKGQAGLWNETGIVMTPTELRYAERFRERYFLYVVEFAGDPERRTLYRIQDPFGKSVQFRFDSGWKAIAVTVDIVEPAEGLQIELATGLGTIVAVRRAGQFFSLEVDMGDGLPSSVLFVPGKMRLVRP